MLYYFKRLFCLCYFIMDFFCIKRYGRAMSQRIYLIDYERNLKDANPFWKFTMMGNSDTIYNLFFSPSKISCDCIDFRDNFNKHRMFLCKHLFYVFGFVAKFTFDDIKHSDFPGMRRKLFRMFDALFDDKRIYCGNGNDDCVICLQPLQENCHQCERCKQIIHMDCLKVWLMQRATCPICRHNTYLSPTIIPPLNSYVATDRNRPSFFSEEGYSMHTLDPSSS